MTTILGLLSDTHGRADAAAAAVRVLRDHGATMLIHLGDVGSEAVLDELVGNDAHVVFGNCDQDEAALTRYAEHLGLTVDHPLGRLDVDGKSVVFSHGHLPELLNAAADEGPVDYLLHGHTHRRRDERRDVSRIINPGALHRARTPSVAVLEPSSDRLEFIEMEAATE